MLDGRVYYVATDKITDKTGKDKYCAYVVGIDRNDNLLVRFNSWFENAIHVNACATKKEAETLKDLWNESYKKNGTFWFCRFGNE